MHNKRVYSAYFVLLFVIMPIMGIFLLTPMSSNENDKDWTSVLDKPEDYDCDDSGRYNGNQYPG